MIFIYIEIDIIVSFQQGKDATASKKYSVHNYLLSVVIICNRL
ncbi:MAG TPA: hypothetical protein VIV55_13145 [Flavobacterium sp.]